MLDLRTPNEKVLSTMGVNDIDYKIYSHPLDFHEIEQEEQMVNYIKNKMNSIQQL